MPKVEPASAYFRKAAALTEQLLSEVAQRAADHSHAGGEGRLQPARRAQDAHRVAREGALADLMRGHSGDPTWTRRSRRPARRLSYCVAAPSRSSSDR